jgi:hypothetical protein
MGLLPAPVLLYQTEHTASLILQTVLSSRGALWPQEE